MSRGCYKIGDDKVLPFGMWLAEQGNKGSGTCLKLKLSSNVPLKCDGARSDFLFAII
jgi:hypothetical protein